jgi:hypothetical protein
VPNILAAVALVTVGAALYLVYTVTQSAILPS